MTATFVCDANQRGRIFPHYWEHTVGSGRAVMALREDWRRQMRRAHAELGFRHVRFHGLLDDDMSILTGEGEWEVYSFFNADSIFDFLLSIGMRPFVELGFMPTALASGDKTVFHYRGNVTAPKDMGKWTLLIEKLLRHFLERYGIDEVRQWFFEVWNEPDLKWFGGGSQAEYFEFYAATARAVKSVDPSLRVGGPATSANAWIADFVAYCRRTGAPVDFITTHHYPTDAFGKPGDDTVTQLSLSPRSVLRDQAAKAKQEADGLPLYYTEWCTSSNPRDGLHDEPYASSFVVKTLMEATGIVDGYSYWTFSDIFEENYFPSRPFHGGFGLLTIHDIAKPTYRAFQLMRGLGTELLESKGAHATVDCWIVRDENELATVVTNFVAPRHPIATERVRVELKGARLPIDAKLTRIDADHANPKALWLEMGSPEYPTREQIAALCGRSELTSMPIECESTRDGLVLALDIPPYGVAVASLRFASDVNA